MQNQNTEHTNTPASNFSSASRSERVDFPAPPLDAMQPKDNTWNAPHVDRDLGGFILGYN